jgi:hypothetical protein
MALWPEDRVLDLYLYLGLSFFARADIKSNQIKSVSIYLLFWPLFSLSQL